MEQSRNVGKRGDAKMRQSENKAQCAPKRASSCREQIGQHSYRASCWLVENFRSMGWWHDGRRLSPCCAENESVAVRTNREYSHGDLAFRV